MTSCTLLERMPRELRDLMYEAALVTEEVIIDATNNRGTYIPALLRVCKQTRAEATKLFYAKNHFRVITPQNAMFTSIAWLKSLSTRSRKQLRMVAIHFVITRYHPGWSYANFQNLQQNELHSMMVMESRFISDKRKVETYDLLEQLATTRDVRRKSVAFEVDDATSGAAIGTSTHGWVHELEDRLHALKDVFADRGIVQDHSWCDHSVSLAKLLVSSSCA